MSLYDALKNGWRAFLDVETIAYADATGAASGVRARRIRPDQKLLGSVDGLAAFQNDYVTFNLWDATLAGKRPLGGGVITQADGTKWTVQAVAAAQWNTQWHCLCVRQIS
ncbi:MAG: hypothetical protein ACIALR_11470 [Blastopirellula sp. JB062]